MEIEEKGGRRRNERAGSFVGTRGGSIGYLGGGTGQEVSPAAPAVPGGCPGTSPMPCYHCEPRNIHKVLVLKIIIKKTLFFSSL